MKQVSLRTSTIVIILMTILQTSTWLIGCEDEGISSIEAAQQALKACRSDESCNECYEQCMESDAGVESCRDSCCRTHGGEKVKAYCEKQLAACRDDGEVSCEAHEKRCQDSKRGHMEGDEKGHHGQDEADGGDAHYKGGDDGHHHQERDEVDGGEISHHSCDR
jgi:hypothetical protein